jgi:bifunctional DNA-binding transcriptional regulator/antitoxin component of YhaV-PrlF toxin-antitoxin module
MKTSHHLQYVESRSKSRPDAVYGKYQVVIPEDTVEKVGWHVGAELIFQVDREKRVIMSLSPPTIKPKKLTYEEARTALFNILTPSSEGLTWTEIHEKNPALPQIPSPFWIRRFEFDLGLKREIDERTGRKLWRISTMPIRLTQQE